MYKQGVGKIKNGVDKASKQGYIEMKLLEVFGHEIEGGDHL
jgi:hypothetical protein